MAKQNVLSKKRQEKHGPLILDGAMGSLLQMQGYVPDKNLWYSKLNVEQPEVIKSIHLQYIEAGADIVTTNTFRTNPIAKKNSDLYITNSELVKRSVALAKQACTNSNVIIAGSNAPTEDCYQQKRTISQLDLEDNHKKHIEMLWEAGVDLIWNETQSHIDEIEIICKFCNKNELPFAMNLFFTNDLKLLSGEPVKDAFEMILAYSPEAIGFNCIHPTTFKKYMKGKQPSMMVNGFYLNCGISET
jgi:homocysteine S-methyltransferase